MPLNNWRRLCNRINSIFFDIHSSNLIRYLHLLKEDYIYC